MNAFDLIVSCKEKVLQGQEVTVDEANELINLADHWVPDLLAAAAHIRRAHKGNRVNLCAIINAKAGRCAENCTFCAQSGHHQSNIETYSLLSKQQLIDGAENAASTGAHFFGIVTSGTKISTRAEWQTITQTIAEINAGGKIAPCASLGMLSLEQAAELKKTGLYNYHHNLETARSFFAEICTTHEYEKDIQTLKNAAAAGLNICSGGLFGLGESLEQRVELAFTLKELNVDSVPMNFLNPIKGTPLGHRETVPPVEALKTVALYRFILPGQDIKLCGGKEVTFRQLLPMGLMAANSLMIGNYLTTSGRSPELDIQIIRDFGLESRHDH